MIPLAEDDFPAEVRVSVRVGKTPYLRFDKNDYSVAYRVKYDGRGCTHRVMTPVSSWPGSPHWWFQKAGSGLSPAYAQRQAARCHGLLPIELGSPMTLHAKTVEHINRLGRLDDIECRTIR
jgi:hypothetical protein